MCWRGERWMQHLCREVQLIWMNKFNMDLAKSQTLLPYDFSDCTRKERFQISPRRIDTPFSDSLSKDN